jgi:tetratricopeptide (TPR) repeat protein
MMRRSSEQKFRSLAPRFQAWLRTNRSYRVISDLLALPTAELAALAGQYPGCATVKAVRTLIERSHKLLGRRPPEAVGLALLATRLVEQVRARRGRLLLLGDAWRQYAGALVDSGEYHAAYQACATAAAFYDLVTPAPPNLERGILALIRGRTLYYLGRTDEALSCLDAARHVLRPLSSAKFLTAQITYAVVLLLIGRVLEAAEIFQQCALLAQDVNDTASLAYITHNMGVCYARLGHDRIAREYLQSAIDEYARLGLVADTLPPRTSLVRVLIHEGKYNEAIGSLFQIRRKYLALDMPVLAADTGLWLLDVLFLANRPREVPVLCEELLEVFQTKNLPHEALKALAYLNESLKQGVSVRKVRRVRDFMGRLASDANAVFLAPVLGPGAL